jgi:hypothetical protein
MEHDCKQADIIKKLEIDLAVAKSDISYVKSDIGDIKASLDKYKWWFMGIIGTIISGVLSIYLKLK